MITNDDGIDAPGLRSLVAEFASIPEVKVVVVAPHLQRSAASHSVSFHETLKVLKSWQEDGVEYYALNGTPSDCVLMGIFALCKVRPDYVLTGINRGANMGYDVSYSATVSAALEAMVHGIPAIAVSLEGRNPVNYSVAARYAHKLFDKIEAVGLAEGEEQLVMPESTILSINVPDVCEEDIKGVIFTNQGVSIYNQNVDKRVSPWGEEYYWIYGELPHGVEAQGSDFKAVKDKFVSITPIHIDFTNYRALEYLRNGKWHF